MDHLRTARPVMNGEWELTLVFSVSLNARQNAPIQLVSKEYSRGIEYSLTGGNNRTIFTQRNLEKIV